MSNPPFNVNGVDKEKIKDDPRYSYGIPRVDNANYLWIQIFASALNQTGRAGFVMANSASDARGSELEIRKKMIEDRIVDVAVAIGPNFFYTVTLPCTLWFLDKGKKGTDRENKVLFIDARQVYHQVDRAHREFATEQIGLIAGIVRLFRRQEVDMKANSMLQRLFKGSSYADVPGLCKVATIEEIAAQGYSLNPGRYVGVSAESAESEDMSAQLGNAASELVALNKEAAALAERILSNIDQLQRKRA
jgi:type I restriction enzyme M protein